MKKIILLIVFLGFGLLPLSGSAQDFSEPELEEGGKKNWYWYDCLYTTGKECKELKNDNSCGRSKTQPVSGC